MTRVSVAVGRGVRESAVAGWKRPLVGAMGALIGLSAGGFAIAQGLEHEIRGVGVLTTSRGPVAVSSVTFTSRNEPRRNAFSATTATGTVTFSGGEAAWPDTTHANVPVDAVLSLAPDGVTDEAASGACEFEISADATFVKSVACRATSQGGGGFSLRFKAGG